MRVAALPDSGRACPKFDRMDHVLLWDPQLVSDGIRLRLIGSSEPAIVQLDEVDGERRA